MSSLFAVSLPPHPANIEHAVSAASTIVSNFFFFVIVLGSFESSSPPQDDDNLLDTYVREQSFSAKYLCTQHKDYYKPITANLQVNNFFDAD